MSESEAERFEYNEVAAAIIAARTGAAAVAPSVAFERTEPDWPVLADDALYGLAGDFVAAIDPHTEADPVATLSNVLAGFGSLAGPRMPNQPSST
jgi:hypothetical protein